MYFKGCVFYQLVVIALYVFPLDYEGISKFLNGSLDPVSDVENKKFDKLALTDIQHVVHPRAVYR